MNTKTNIVVIILDTLRAADVGCYGNARIHTPTIDALATLGSPILEKLRAVSSWQPVYMGRMCLK